MIHKACCKRADQFLTDGGRLIEFHGNGLWHECNWKDIGDDEHRSYDSDQCPHCFPFIFEVPLSIHFQVAN